MSTASKKPSRFTASIKIVEIETIEYSDYVSGRTVKDTVTKDTELASIVVRAGDLETLKSDISAHVALVKDMKHNGSDNAIQTNN